VSYVFDDDVILPTGKSDYNTRPDIPANKKVVASEWGRVMTAVADLKTAILNARFLGLNRSAGATISVAGQTRIRSNAGVIEVSDNGGAYVPLGGSSSGGGIRYGLDALTALTTTSDYMMATSTVLPSTPVGWAMVLVNGAQEPVGDGVRTASCYFSHDGGITAKTHGTLALGDSLFWVGSVAGYQLKAGWRISIVYMEA